MRFSLTNGGKGNLKSTATAATALASTFSATPTPSLHGAHGISNHSTISHVSSTNITSNASTIAFPPPTTAGGLSTFGTLQQPYLPQWLGSSKQAPWGSRTVADSLYTSSNVPNTGVTRHYTFNVAAGTTDADGVVRDTITVNGQFPGPLIEANWGDWFEITVINDLAEEGTTIHWHGLRQAQTPEMDGVPSLSQCPIAPGQSFTYRFQAEVYGSSWYHSHYSAQANGGALGPMVIYGPSSANYDIDVGPVLVTDWYHPTYESLVAEYVGTDLGLLPFTSDNNLINGRNNYPCDSMSLNTTSPTDCTENAPLSAFKLVTGKTHRMRIVNGGTEGVQKFSIDQHNFTVIAQDFVSVTPFVTDVLTLGVGQRTDIIVSANLPSDTAVWMRSTISDGGGCTGSANPDVMAAIFYDGADTTVAPSSEPNESYNEAWIESCYNDVLTEEFAPSAAMAVEAPSVVTDVYVDLVENSTGHFVWELNNRTFHGDYNLPIANQVSKGNLSFPDDWQVFNYMKNSTIRINLYNGINATHPWHVHGRDMQILSEGAGEWDGSIVRQDNPVRRDVHLIRAFGHLAMQFPGDNAGVWPFHCHIAWHLSGGLYMNLLIDPEAMKPFPDIIDGTCDAWDAWSNKNVVDEIDSGL